MLQPKSEKFVRSTTQNNYFRLSIKAFLLDTTDVQKVWARQTENAVQIQCDFISCSDAQGCMVVLVGDAVNTTVNVSRCELCDFGVLNLTTTNSSSCYHAVFAFDIELNGSVGTLAIDGEFTSGNGVGACHQKSSSGEHCMTNWKLNNRIWCNFLSLCCRYRWSHFKASILFWSTLLVSTSCHCCYVKITIIMFVPIIAIKFLPLIWMYWNVCGYVTSCFVRTQ